MVLFNEGNISVSLSDPDVMFGAMYGDVGVTMKFDPGKGSVVDGTDRIAFLEGGKMINERSSKPQNTTISALITLRIIRVGVLKYNKYYKETENPVHSWQVDWDIEEKKLGLIVWENTVARMPLPKELFRGDYDVRFTYDFQKIRRVFAGDIIKTLEADPFGDER